MYAHYGHVMGTTYNGHVMGTTVSGHSFALTQNDFFVVHNDILYMYVGTLTCPYVNKKA